MFSLLGNKENSLFMQLFRIVSQTNCTFYLLLFSLYSWIEPSVFLILKQKSCFLNWPFSAILIFLQIMCINIHIQLSNAHTDCNHQYEWIIVTYCIINNNRMKTQTIQVILILKNFFFFLLKFLVFCGLTPVLQIFSMFMHCRKLDALTWIQWDL